MATITRRGVEIPKDDSPTGHRVAGLVRRELCVAPVTLNDPFPKKFKVFLESPTKWVVPLHWARAALAQVELRDARAPGHDANLTFSGSLREDLRQPEAVQAVLDTWANTGGAMLCLPPGFGKCLAPETPVLTYAGDTIRAADLRVGMRLLGMDGTPRTVLDVGRGQEMMYEIRPTKGDPWRCNETHILCLRYSGHGAIKAYGERGGRVNFCDTSGGGAAFGCRAFQDRELAKAFAAALPNDPIVDVSVRDYLRLPAHVRKNLKLFHSGRVTFEPRPPPLFDPYVIGAWLGDGSRGTPTFTIVENELVREIERRCDGMILRKVTQKVWNRAPQYYLRRHLAERQRGNPFKDALTQYGIVNSKRIPGDIKCGTIETRLAVLAGLLDTDGHLAGNCFEITQKREGLANDIAFVARSLGFAASVKRVTKVCVKPDGSRVPGQYVRVIIYGDGLPDIPTVLPRKRAHARLQKRDALVTGFECVPVGSGRYVGPVLDGDHRYLLGDFTVTHNTVTALYLAAQVKKKVLVLVHKAFLKDQWAERVGQCLPGAKVTAIQGDACDTSGDVVIAMIQTLLSRKYPSALFEPFGLVITDESHHIGAAAFSQAMWGLCAPRTLALTATPDRKDGLTRVVSWFSGPIAFRVRRENQETTRVKVVRFACPEFEAPPPVNRRGDVCFTTVVTRLVENERRTAALVEEIAALARAGRDVLVLTHRRQHCFDLAAAATARGVECGTYVGGDKAAPDTRVVVATYALTSEGFDMPRLNALVLATPASDVEQSCGRVMRGSSASGAIIVDWLDQWGVCYSQHAKRRGYYKRSGFVVDGNESHAAATAPPPAFAFVDD